MQLEIGAGGDVQSENNFDQTIEQVIADGIKLSKELALSIDSISPTAIVSSPGPLSSVPSLDPPAPDWKPFSELVTQLTITDKLRNLNHDIEE